MSIAENIVTVQRQLAAALLKRIQKGQEHSPVTLIAVTKNQDIAAMKQAIAAGIQTLGENRVQEALEKLPQLSDVPLSWHLIGHLQTNKVRHAVAHFDLIHSVDSLHLAAAINRAAEKIGKRQGVLAQINVAGEAAKFGVAPEEALAFCRQLADLPNLELAGVMTIAPHYEDGEQARPVFRELYRLYRELQYLDLPAAKIRWLSMGMSNDYRIAVEEGANLVRIGSAIFGPRQ